MKSFKRRNAYSHATGFSRLMLMMYFLNFLTAHIIAQVGGPSILEKIQTEQSYYVYPDNFDANTAPIEDIDNGKLITFKKEIKLQNQNGADKTTVTYLAYPSYYNDFKLKPGYTVTDNSGFKVYASDGQLIFSKKEDSIITAMKAYMPGNLPATILNPVSIRFSPTSGVIQHYQSLGYNIVEQSSEGIVLSLREERIEIDFLGLSLRSYKYDAFKKQSYELLQQYYPIGKDSMVLKLERVRKPIQLKSGVCAEKVLLKKIEKYIYNNREIVVGSKLARLQPELEERNLNQIPAIRIMAEDKLVVPSISQSMINIKKPEGVNYMVIINIQGSKINEFKTPTELSYLDVAISDLANGVYFVLFYTDDKLITKDNFTKI